ncbi:MAG: DUF4912 domain-containing protein [Hydrogenothermaceae bacterium]|nr:DUF4912 domain-containing protein [Hydrogenothermaceae bacterium]
MINPIVEMSFLEDNFSSHINLVAEEVSKQKLPDLNIPDRYNINRFVILPVNPNLIYSYWFTEDNLKEDINSKYNNFKVIIKLFAENEFVKDIEVSSLEGEIYFNFHGPFKKVKSVLGIYHNTDFEQLIESNQIVMPSDTIFVEEDQHWFDKKKNTVVVKKSDIDYIDEFNSIIREKSGVFLNYSSILNR